MSSFKITNFRVFDSEGVKVDFSPVTILTGANNSGKSSFVKAMVLLKDWLDGLREEYKRTGTFLPASHPMDFTRADLKLKGFKGTKNRNSAEDSKMTFSLSVDLGVLLGDYTVEWAFAPQEGVLDMGVLDSIRILRGDYELYLARREGETFKTVQYDFQSFFLLFREFETLYVIPSRFLLKYENPIREGFISEVCDEEGNLDLEKLNSTEEGRKLLAIQSCTCSDLDQPIWDRAILIDLPYQGEGEEPHLFGEDLSETFEIWAKTFNNFATDAFVFYFPVLDRFKGASKEESIRILKEDIPECKSLMAYGAWTPDVNQVIDAFEKSNHESFLDFYIEQETVFLDNVHDKDSDPFGLIYYYEDFISEFTSKINVSLYYDGESFHRLKGLFPLIYNVFSIWQWAEDERGDSSWIAANEGRECVEPYTKGTKILSRTAHEVDWGCHFSSNHRIYSAYISFMSYLMHKLLMPDSLSRMTYFSDSFTPVQRLHSFDEASCIVSAVRAYLDSRNKFDRFKKEWWIVKIVKDKMYSPGAFINKWLKEFNIGEELSVKVDDEGVGFKLYIREDGYEESIADMGHGVSQLGTLLLLIETAILDGKIRNEEKGKAFIPASGQEGLEARKVFGRHRGKLPPAILVVEEPEVSLHPNYQSKLASMFEDAANNYGVDIHFIVETHSEYLVRKTQAIVSGYDDRQFKRNPFSVYYFTDEGHAYSLGYRRSGRFERPFGEGFFDESARLNYQVLRKEQELSKD